MTIRLLGTGGAEGIPALFGDDPVSEWARAHGGRDLRTHASAIVDEGLKIDLSPDTPVQMLANDLRATDWDLLLFTHSDDDHFAIAQLQYALYPFTACHALPFPIYGNDVVLAKIRAAYPHWPFDLVRMAPFEAFETAGYRITPLRARHTPGEECFNFLVERDGRRLVYATDTGVWPEETLTHLRGVRLDLLVVECTNAFRPSDYPGHLDLQTLAYLLSRLREGGALDERSRVVTTHHSAAGGARHCDLGPALAPLGAEPGYDGMVLEV